METGWYYFRISFFYFPYTNMIFIIFVKNWLSSVVLIIGSFKFKFFVIFKIFVHWSCNSFSSARPVSKVFENEYMLLWFLNIRSIWLGLFDWKHVGSLIKLLRLDACMILWRWVFPVVILKSPAMVTLSYFWE